MSVQITHAPPTIIDNDEILLMEKILNEGFAHLGPNYKWAVVRASNAYPEMITFFVYLSGHNIFKRLYDSSGASPRDMIEDVSKEFVSTLKNP